MLPVQCDGASAGKGCTGRVSLALTSAVNTHTVYSIMMPVKNSNILPEWSLQRYQSSQTISWITLNKHQPLHQGHLSLSSNGAVAPWPSLGGILYSRQWPILGEFYVASIMQLPQFWCLFVVSDKWTQHCKNKYAFIQIHEVGFSKKLY